MLRTIFFSLLVLAVAGGVATVLWKCSVEVKGLAPEKLVPSVVVVEAKPSDVSLTISSQGVLEAKILTSAASEVSGKVIEVSPAFAVGGKFEEGDVLLRVEPADYEAAQAQAQARLAEAKLTVVVEEAKAEQSVREWERLGHGEVPSSLVKREPQLASAKAHLEAAEAGARKAARDLKRTVLRAPYRGAILRTHTDVASFVAVGSPLADFYASEALEVRLPISLGDLEFLDADVVGTAVVLSLSTGQSWRAEVVRREWEIDRRSRSLHLIAAVEVGAVGEEPLLVPGLFVRASIEGKTINGVYEIPRRALHHEDELVLVRADNTLEKRVVQVLRKEVETILVGEGLRAGDRVCLSFLPAIVEGMEVRLVGNGEGQG